MSNDRAVHVMVVEGFAVWEPAHALAGLRCLPKAFAAPVADAAR